MRNKLQLLLLIVLLSVFLAQSIVAEENSNLNKGILYLRTRGADEESINTVALAYGYPNAENERFNFEVLWMEGRRKVIWFSFYTPDSVERVIEFYKDKFSDFYKIEEREYFTYAEGSKSATYYFQPKKDSLGFTMKIRRGRFGGGEISLNKSEVVFEVSRK